MGGTRMALYAGDVGFGDMPAVVDFDIARSRAYTVKAMATLPLARVYPRHGGSGRFEFGADYARVNLAIEADAVDPEVDSTLLYMAVETVLGRDSVCRFLPRLVVLVHAVTEGAALGVGCIGIGDSQKGE